MNTLTISQSLSVNGQLMPDNGTVYLVLQGDGNLVLYRTDNNEPIWASNTDGRGADSLVMQSDGNLVLYRNDGHPVWASNTDGTGGTRFIVQEDANLVIYRADGRAVWASNTNVVKSDLGLDSYNWATTFPHMQMSDNDAILTESLRTETTPPSFAITNSTPVSISLAILPLMWWKAIEIRNWHDEVLEEIWAADGKQLGMSSASWPMYQLSNGRLILKKAKLFGIHTPMHIIQLPNLMRNLVYYNDGLSLTPPPPPDQFRLTLTWQQDGGPGSEP